MTITTRPMPDVVTRLPFGTRMVISGMPMPIFIAQPWMTIRLSA